MEEVVFCKECIHENQRIDEPPCDNCRHGDGGRKAESFYQKKVPPDHINPPHYKDGSGMETIDKMIAIWGKEEVAIYCKISSFKYRDRAGKKDPAKITEDINKALWFERKAKELKWESK